jgi:formylglycine-generating enzyme required for sulfatase activity
MKHTIVILAIAALNLLALGGEKGTPGVNNAKRPIVIDGCTYVFIPGNMHFEFNRDIRNRSAQKESSPITNGYWMAQYPVVNSDYARFCDATKHKVPRYWKNGSFPKDKARHPVLWVSVEDVKSYIEYLEQRNPKWKFRLPSEAEWENAAKGSRNYAFPWGDSDGVDIIKGQIVSRFNFNAVVASHYLQSNPTLEVAFANRKSKRFGEKNALNSLITVRNNGQVRGWINHREHAGFVYTDLFRRISDEGGFTTAVDRYPKGVSEYGCFDMSGNSWDWTSSEIVASNGAERGKRVNAIRGGSWYANKNSCRTDYRGEGRNPKGCYSTVGFRLVAEPK